MIYLLNWRNLRFRNICQVFHTGLLLCAAHAVAILYYAVGGSNSKKSSHSKFFVEFRIFKRNKSIDIFNAFDGKYSISCCIEEFANSLINYSLLSETMGLSEFIDRLPSEETAKESSNQCNCEKNF